MLRRTKWLRYLISMFAGYHEGARLCIRPTITPWKGEIEKLARRRQIMEHRRQGLHTVSFLGVRPK